MARNAYQPRCRARQKNDCRELIVVDLKNTGTDFFDKEVVMDNDTLVTSRTPDDLPAFNRESLRILNKP